MVRSRSRKNLCQQFQNSKERPIHISPVALPRACLHEVQGWRPQLLNKVPPTQSPSPAARGRSTFPKPPAAGAPGRCMFSGMSRPPGRFLLLVARLTPPTSWFARADMHSCDTQLIGGATYIVSHASLSVDLPHWLGACAEVSKEVSRHLCT